MEQEKLNKSLKKIEDLINSGRFEEIDRKKLIEIWQFANVHNLVSIRNRITKVMEKYMALAKKAKLQIVVDWEKLPQQIEELKKEEGLSDEDIKIVKQILYLYIDNELRKRDKQVSEEIKEVLVNLQIYVHLYEQKIFEEFEKIAEILESKIL